MKENPTICLNMIVKDEAAIILRCLESIKDVVSYWVISDTGSTDGTQQIIKDFFSKHEIEGELWEEEWQDFSYNRNYALSKAKGKADYLLMMDADDYFIAEEGFRFKNLESDSYMLEMEIGLIRYFVLKLVRADINWWWKGVLHEFLTSDAGHTIDQYQGDYLLKATCEGARGKNPDKYKQDIEVLTKALLDEPDNTRYQFYLAQSYRDNGDFEKAVEHYQKRVAMGGWDEEVYMSLYGVATNQVRFNKDHMAVIESFLNAYYFRPSRLEALYEAVRLCRVSGHYFLGYHLGASAINQEMTTDILFVSTGIYQWQLKDEIAICASWVGQKDEARKITNELLEMDCVPNGDKNRLKGNLAFC
jgi:glycosyltransferase involved in cell wall biosynthesis